MNYSYLNGEIVDYNDCRVHISDLLIQRGYGVFDFFRCRNGVIPWLDDYTERLFNSIKLSGIEVYLNAKEFKDIVFQLQEKNGYANGAFKVIVTGGYSDNLAEVSGESNIIILNVEWNSPPQESFEKGVHLISSEYTRLDPEIKTLYYFNLLKLHKKMKEAGAVDVLYHLDLITETSRANVFFVKDNKILTPGRNILKGVIRKQIIQMNGDIELADIPFNNIYDFDEMFIASTSRDITPVVYVDEKKIGPGKPGKITLGLMKAFRSMY